MILPYPPSANRLWRNVNGKTLKSAEYRAWMTNAQIAILCAKPEKIRGRYELEVLAHRPDRRPRDLGNLEKAISDALVQGGVVEDDHLAKKITLCWADEPVDGGRIDITVRAA